MKKSKKHNAGATSCSQVPRLAAKSIHLELISGIKRIKRINRIFRNPNYQVSGAAARSLPSTRAGGQDDVSSKQTPSN